MRIGVEKTVREDHPVEDAHEADHQVRIFDASCFERFAIVHFDTDDELHRDHAARAEVVQDLGNCGGRVRRLPKS